MKLLIFLALTSSVLSFMQDEVLLLQFDRFKEMHGKSYRDFDEQQKRFGIFKQNLHLIEKLNKEEIGTAEYEMNQFADLSQEEFKAKYLLPSRPAPEHSPSQYLQTSSFSIPDSFDWRQNSTLAVTSVKDQGSFGSCFAFSAVGNIEGQWGLKKGQLVDLSVEQIIECASNVDLNNGNANCGGDFIFNPQVFGGWPYLVFDHIKQTGGIASEADYPYCIASTVKGQQCDPCSPPGYNKTACGPGLKPPACDGSVLCKEHNGVKFTAKITGWKAVSKNETEIAQTLVSNGPLSVALNALQLQFYRKGVFAPYFCDPQSLDHAVLLVGYGVEPKSFLKKETPYWIVKNTWSEKWGENGYFRIERNTGRCGINTAVTTVEV